MALGIGEATYGRGYFGASIGSGTFRAGEYTSELMDEFARTLWIHPPHIR